MCYVCCWCTAISIVALSTTVPPTAALISTGLLAKTSCTSLLQWQTSPLRQARERHSPYRFGSAQTSVSPGCPAPAVLEPCRGSQPHCRTREIHLDWQVKKWSTRPKPSGTSSSLSLCLYFNVSLEQSQNVPSRRLKRHRRWCGFTARIQTPRFFFLSECYVHKKSQKNLIFQNKADGHKKRRWWIWGRKASWGSVRIKAWTRLEKNQETSWHLRRTVSRPTSKHSQEACQKHNKVQLTLVKWMLLAVFYRDSIAVHGKTHVERLLFGIPDAETRRREAAYKRRISQCQKLIRNCLKKTWNFMTLKIFCEIPFSVSFFRAVWENMRRALSTRTQNLSCSRVRAAVQGAERLRERQPHLSLSWLDYVPRPYCNPAFQLQRLDHVLDHPQTMK